MSTLNINDLLLKRLKENHDFDQVEIYHFRSLLGQTNNFMSYKDLNILREKTPALTNLLNGGFTVVLIRDSSSLENAICSISYCSSEDNFDKSKGINICLKRLDNYLSKPEKSSWNYNPNNFFHLSELSEERGTLVDSVSKYLNRHYNPFTNRGIKVYNCAA